MIFLKKGRTIGVLRFDSRWGLRIFLFTTASRTALGPTQPPTQWVPRAISLGVEWQGRETDHSPQCTNKVKNVRSYTSTPQYAFMAWCLVKHRDNFNFTLLNKIENEDTRKQLHMYSVNGRQTITHTKNHWLN
jgi:hypothetical protein